MLSQRKANCFTLLIDWSAEIYLEASEPTEFHHPKMAINFHKPRMISEMTWRVLGIYMFVSVSTLKDPL